MDSLEKRVKKVEDSLAGLEHKIDLLLNMLMQQMAFFTEEDDESEDATFPSEMAGHDALSFKHDSEFN